MVTKNLSVKVEENKIV